MDRIILLLVLILPFVPAPSATATPSPSPWPEPWRSIQRELGGTPKVVGEGFQLAFPRWDLNLSIEGIPLEPQMVESVLRFSGTAKDLRVEGEWALLDREVPLATERLMAAGFRPLGLGASFLGAYPGTRGLVFEGAGPRDALVAGLQRALRGTGALRKAPAPTPMSTPAAGKDPPLFVEGTFGPGEREGFVLRYRLEGKGPERTSSLTFQGNAERLTVHGDWAVETRTSPAVLRSLLKAGARPYRLGDPEGADPSSVRIRFYASGPSLDLLAVLSREWAKLSRPPPTPAP
jgi:hypothetical protein